MLPGDVASAAYRFVFDNLRTLLVAGWPIIIFLTAFEICVSTTSGRAMLYTILPQIILETVFALLWHRFYLLGHINRAWWQGLGLPSRRRALSVHGPTIRKFVLWSLIFQLAIIPPFLLVLAVWIPVFPEASGTNDSLAVVGAIALVSLFFCRYLPFFPAVAIGGTDTRIGDAFRLTKGHTLRIWAAFMICLVPLLVLNAVIAVPLAAEVNIFSQPGDLEIIVRSLAYATISLFLVAIGASANSEIFRRLSGRERSADVGGT